MPPIDLDPEDAISRGSVIWLVREALRLTTSFEVVTTLVALQQKILEMDSLDTTENERSLLAEYTNTVST